MLYIAKGVGIPKKIGLKAHVIQKDANEKRTTWKYFNVKCGS